MRRLTEAERELAGRPEHVRYAAGAARRWARKFPHLWDEFESAAGLALCVAARGFRPEVGDEFERYLNRVLRSVLSYTVSLARPRGYRRRDPSAAPTVEQEGAALGESPSAESPVGWEVESEDSVLAATARLSARDRKALVAYLLDAGCAGSATAAGLALGYGTANGPKVVRAGLAKLRAADAAVPRVG